MNRDAVTNEEARIAAESDALAWHSHELGDVAEPGMYLMLFHGRDAPDQDMDDWGYDGPIIGPLEYFHVTYLTHISYRFTDGTESDGPSDVLALSKEELLVLRSPQGTKFFGDWSLFHHKGGTL